MKLPLSWLSDHLEANEAAPDAPALARRLTMLGLEVEAVTPVAARIERLVVGRVLELRPHPNADRLSLCRVDVGAAEPLGIVCGARNVRAGGVYATALEGASLPGGLTIKATKIRGEASAGMLCAASELGLESAAAGLLELDADAVPGRDANTLLHLGDAVLDINITPNRADCFSILGIARELVAAGVGRLREPAAAPTTATDSADVAVKVQNAADCPRFLGRVIRGLRADARTPLWMQERLRRCGVRPIHPVVDVTNYVMLDLGQPMHAYDLRRLRGAVQTRRALPDEVVELLDGKTYRLDPEVLVIADDSGAIGLAGIMGGVGTAVSDTTTDVFLECAFFAPAAIAGRARRFGLHTEASLRFERGVDPALTARAMERASELILAIAGGTASHVVATESTTHLADRPFVLLRRDRLRRVLGIELADAAVEAALKGLRMQVERTAAGWQVSAPSWRFDIEREEDLVEEVARITGYDGIPVTPGEGALRPAPVGESPDGPATLIGVMMARGWQEAVTYSFVPQDLDRRFGGSESPALVLANPISADLAVMRQSLWPGLVRALDDNLNRQQDRVKLFEMGPRFMPAANGHREEICIAGAAAGTRVPEQWGARSEPLDFYDIKADVQALLRATGREAAIRFAAATHPALHPGRSARIDLDGSPIGWVGEMHPALATSLKLPTTILFELSAAGLLSPPRPAWRPVSVFPAVRRDLALVVDREVPAAALLDCVRRAVPDLLQTAFVFDIYAGAQVGATEKSVAIGLILQDTSRTLTDEDSTRVLQQARAALSRDYQARIRE